MFVNWSQPKTRESFFKRQKPCYKDLTNKTQRLPLIKNLLEMLVGKDVLTPKCNCSRLHTIPLSVLPVWGSPYGSIPILDQNIFI